MIDPRFTSPGQKQHLITQTKPPVLHRQHREQNLTVQPDAAQ
jgi:hypothetical protein